MEMHIYFTLLKFTLIFYKTTFSKGSYLDLINEPIENEILRNVHIEFNKNLSKLTIKSLNGSILNDINIKRLDPSKSIYSPNLSVGFIKKRKNGQTIFKNHLPSLEVLNQVQAKIYTDSSTNSILTVHELEGKHYLDGILNDFQILSHTNSSKNGVHILRKRNMLKDNSTSFYPMSNKKLQSNHKKIFKRHLIIKEIENHLKPKQVDDIVRYPEDNETTFISGRAINTGPAVVEIAIVIDYENSKKLGMDLKKAIDYASVMITSTNEFVSNLKLSKISTVLSGVYLIQSPEIERESFYNSITNDGSEDLEKVLRAFNDWAEKNSGNIPSHDFLALLTSFNYGDVAGLAGKGTVCRNSPKQNTAAAVDIANTWSGLLTFAHELGHHIGSSHDNEKTKDCPPADGYIMSYEGRGGPYRYHFSLCSEQEIQKTIQSEKASCLYRSEASDTRSLHVNVGNFANTKTKLDEICKLFHNDVGYEFFEKDPDLTCSMLYCKKSSKTSTSIIDAEILLGNGISCGSSGKCKNGFCIGHKNPIMTKEDRDEVCREKSRDKTALADHDFYIYPEWRNCVMIRCIVTKLTNEIIRSYHYKIYNIWMGDGVPCGMHGGKCKDGDCISNEKKKKSLFSIFG